MRYWFNCSIYGIYSEIMINIQLQHPTLYGVYNGCILYVNKPDCEMK